ncbi:BCCT transporter [Dorea sp. D27]|nr:BCCT transporter [Dorea sp. D27]
MYTKEGNVNMSNGNDKTVHISLRKRVFFPPWILLIVLVGISLLSEKSFLSGMQAATGFILDNFAWAFNLTTLGCLAVVIIVFVSPLGKVRIGGSKARPIMKFRNLAWITLCTTVASGVLFWACAEPLYHMYTPAAAEGVEAGSPGAAVFAMKTMFLEWTWSPYAIYTVATLLFAFVFYNMRKSYSIGSAFVPVFGDKAKRYNGIIDVICLFALVLGMAASLGTGTLTMGGGIENVFGIKSGPVSWGFIILAIVATFIISSVSGVMKGIKLLSSLNGQVYIFLLLFVLIFGPTAFMMNFSVESLGAYVQDFFRMSLMTGDIHGDPWARSWPIFYWCVWMAWAPISGVFLGKILKGYTIRDAIVCNFVIPSVFSMVWMGLFSTASIYFENHGVGLYDSLLKNGTESVVYKVFEQLPLAAVVIPFYLFIVFISFVTAADSNTNAMSGLCVKGLTVDNQESPSWLKICWGLTLGVLTWVLISFAGIDGIKAASNLGGFPIMFIIIIFIVGLLKVCRNPKKYDMFQEDYDSEGRPIESVRLPIETEE